MGSRNPVGRNSVNNLPPAYGLQVTVDHGRRHPRPYRRSRSHASGNLNTASVIGVALGDQPTRTYLRLKVRQPD